MVAATNQAPSRELVAARKMRNDARTIVAQAAEAARNLQQACSAAEARSKTLDDRVSALWAEAAALAARAGNGTAGLTGARQVAEAADNESKTASRTVLMARSTAVQRVYKACMRLEVEKTVKHPDLRAVVEATAAAFN